MLSIYDKVMRVVTFGTFDHLHPGHLSYLKEAEGKGELCIIVARDQNVHTIKGRRADQSETQRAAALQAAFPNAVVVLGDAKDYIAPVRALKPDLIVMGYDQQLPPGVAVEDLPCPVHRAKPFVPEIHKSSLRRELS